MEKLLTLEEVAEILGISKLTLKKNISKDPGSVPPCLKTPPRFSRTALTVGF